MCIEKAVIVKVRGIEKCQRLVDVSRDKNNTAVSFFVIGYFRQF